MKTTQSGRAVLPFLKWAGGKRWLAQRHDHLLNAPFDRFIEPFLGSGAVFFSLMPQSAILSDKNQDLIDTYCAIKEDWELVYKLLSAHHLKHSNNYYYHVRKEEPLDRAQRAAQFIYLNRTCWNGLYRVNLKGEFNVPIGTKMNVILPSDNFEAVSRILQNVQLLSCDFETTIARAGKGDFLFIDPPYTVQHNHNEFVKYNENLFSWDDQIRLRTAAFDAVARGSKLLMTNANHECIRKLYEGLGEHMVLTRGSVISGSGVGRKRCEEMVIKCF